MAVKAVPIWICGNQCNSQLGFVYSGNKRSGSGLNLRVDVGRWRKWECLGLSAQRAKIPVEDEKPLTSSVGIESTQITESSGFHKDLSSLPSELLFICNCWCLCK